MSRAALTAVALRAAVHYDCATGHFTRKGERAGGVDANGYRRVSVLGQQHYEHRLAVLYVTGEWPRFDVDHINGNTADNRWINLRDVPTHVNCQNQRAGRRDNSTGLLGVVPNGKRFTAQIQTNGVVRSLGQYDTPEQAHIAYIAAKRQLHEGNTL